MKMLLVAIFALSCAQISNALIPTIKWFNESFTTPPYPPGADYATCNHPYIKFPAVYLIKPNYDVDPFKVYCEIVDGKQWTVIQRRFDQFEDFYRSYAEYTRGFGQVSGNHWLGLEKIHQLTKNFDHELLVELQAHNSTSGYARYSTFMVGSKATGFRLTISGYRGTAGDTMTLSNAGWNLNGMKFSTYDKDQDTAKINCAQKYHGAWWYKSCSGSNLNGRYYNTPVWSWELMNWFYNFSALALKSSRMMVRKKPSV